MGSILPYPLLRGQPLKDLQSGKISRRVIVIVAILMCKLLGANCNRFDKLLLKRYSSFLCLLQN